MFSYLPLAGGMGLFLYGITLLGESLERAAGSRLPGILARATRGRVRPMLLGLGVTSVIQSSTAATVMAVGMVNGGLLPLEQAAAMILGANIGTTATAWLLSLSGLSAAGRLPELFRPSGFAQLLVLAGGMLYLLGKTPQKKAKALLPLGFGLLFLGMTIMEQTLLPLSRLPAFRTAFLQVDSPLLCVLTGALLAAAIQSSSASVGLLQALASTGLVPVSCALPILLGQNIGTCTTVLLAAIGASSNARKAALVHLYFNLIGAALFLLGIFGLRALGAIPFWDAPITRGGISLFHTLFNLGSTALLLPNLDCLLRLAEATAGGSKWKTPASI